MKQLLLTFATIALFSQIITAQDNSGAVQAWLEDYAAIKKYMAEAYANFEWAATKIDLPALDKRTTEALRAAKTEAEAQAALKEFFQAFRDGHLAVRKLPAAASGAAFEALPRDLKADAACARLGFRPRPSRFSVPFEKNPAFRRLGDETEPFPSGVVELGERRIGVVAIQLFAVDGYFANCASAWEEFRAGLAADCDESCAARFRELAERRLTASLAATIERLAAAKPSALVVDIGGNGGGNDWVEVVARMLTPKPLDPPVIRHLRHPHWVAILKSHLKDVEYDLGRKGIDPQLRKMLVRARAGLRERIVDAGRTCDLSPLWNGAKPACSLISAQKFGIGELAPEMTEEKAGVLLSKKLFARVEPYEYRKGIWTGPLFVLVDRRSASASEEFASMMQSSGAAKVVGSRTYGAGCGYIDGGTDYVLPRSGLRLLMPDCVRYRVDGVNEVEGIKPDFEIFAETADADTRLDKTLAFLASGQAAANASASSR